MRQGQGIVIYPTNPSGGLPNLLRLSLAHSLLQLFKYRYCMLYFTKLVICYIFSAICACYKLSTSPLYEALSSTGLSNILQPPPPPPASHSDLAPDPSSDGAKSAKLIGVGWGGGGRSNFIATNEQQR
jgi:hypothetical protein